MSHSTDDYDDTEPIDDLARSLASYDEQLRCGGIKNPPSATTIEAALNPESSLLINCLHLLERAWPRTVPTDNAAIPSEIGRFKIEGVLGVGGFGVVYKAFDPRLQREIALKVPRLHTLSSRELLARFEREAKAAASLDHLNIVPVYETGQAGQNYYIAAAYCAGPNLAEWLKAQKSPVPIRIAAALIRELAKAVEYSHSKGVLHRDLKPGNVMLVPHGDGSSQAQRDILHFTPRLTDFGLARPIDNTEYSTINTIVGTPSYMAPEQTTNNASAIGTATDIYGLGAILYEVLTGRPPFQGANTPDLFDQIQNTDPISPRRLRREISVDLDTICLKCLEKIPANRFASAKDLGLELDRYLSGESIKSRPVGMTVHFLRWCQRRPSAAALIAVSITAIIAINALLVARNQSLVKYNQEITKLSENLTTAAHKARAMQLAAEKNEQQIKAALYTADINRAAAAWKDEDTKGMTELLDRHIPKPGEPDHRGFEWWFLHRQAGRAHRVLIDNGSAFYILTSSPDNRLMAVAGLDAVVRLFDPQTGEISQEIRTGQVEVNGLAFSNNGKELATAGDDGTIRCWNLSTGRERLNIKAHPGRAYHLLFTPDDQEIVSCGDNPVIQVFDAQSGEKRRQFVGHVHDVQSLSLGFGAKSLVSSSTDGTVNVWNFNSTTWENAVDRQLALGAHVLLEQRDLILVGSEGGELLSYQISTHTKLATGKHPDGVDSIAVHPNGKLIATGTGGGSIRWWNLGPHGELTESDIPPWQAHQGNVYSLAWTADGSRLISTGKDGRVNSWNVSAIQSTNPRKIVVPANSGFCLIPKTDFLFHFQDIPDQQGMFAIRWRTDSQITPLVPQGTGYLGFLEFDASRNGQFLVGLRNRQELHLFELEKLDDRPLNLKHLRQWVSPGQLANARFSPDSSSIAVSQWYRPTSEAPEEHFVWLHSVSHLENRERIPVPNAKLAEFSPDGKFLLLARQSSLTLWDLDRRKIVWDVPKSEQAYLAFSPNGRLVATGGDDRLVIIRNASDGSLRYRMSGHRGKLRGLTFSPDGRTLASCDWVGTLKLWSVDVGQELFEFRNIDTIASKVMFSRDGKHLLVHTYLATTEQRSRHDELLIFDAIENEQ